MFNWSFPFRSASYTVLPACFSQPQKTILLFQDGFMVWKVSSQPLKLGALEPPVENAGRYLLGLHLVSSYLPKLLVLPVEFSQTSVLPGFSFLQIRGPGLRSPGPGKLEALRPELTGWRCRTRVHFSDTLRWLSCSKLLPASPHISV